MLIIHGETGQHAQDLGKRGVLKGLNTLPTNPHIISVPIYATKYNITELLKSVTVAPEDIVNLAGIMSTSPNGIHNLHFLFGPSATTNLSVATAGVLSRPGRIILDTVRVQGMRIIETTREEHDVKMAIIQGLSHFLLVFIGGLGDNDIHKNLIAPWIAPEGTIQDMIFQNIPAEAVITEFFDTIQGNDYNPLKTFEQIVDTYLTSDDIDKFSTPNFRRILQVISEGNIQISMNEVYVGDFRNALNAQGMRFISAQVQSIRQFPSY